MTDHKKLKGPGTTDLLMRLWRDKRYLYICKKTSVYETIIAIDAVHY